MQNVISVNVFNERINNKFNGLRYKMLVVLCMVLVPVFFRDVFHD